MTGSYQQRSGIGWVITASKGREDGIDPNKNTIAKLLRNNGYDTAMFGKWHLGYPEKHNPIHLGFNHFVGYVSGNVDYFTHIDGAGHPDWWHNNKLQEENGYTTTLITDYSEKYLKQKHDKPFFLYVPFEACHSPWQGPNDKAIKGIVDGKCKYFHKPQIDPKVIYKDMIEYLDVCVGRIIKTVKTQGLLDNTMIVLFSDNGGSINSCNAPLSGKKDMVLEGGHRVPAIVYWPNKVKPGISNETIMSMDILPSVCKLTHTKYHKKNFDGKNFLPVIFKNKKMPSRTIFIKNKLVVSARKDNWKLMINEETGEKILIDLNTDLIEKNNLANKYPKKVKKLTK